MGSVPWAEHSKFGDVVPVPEPRDRRTPVDALASISADERDEEPQVELEETWDFSLVGREINERIGALTPLIIAGEKMSLVCECGDGDCQAFVQLTPAQYHGIRQNLTTFVVTKGHESPGTDEVLSRSDSWVIVHKSSEARGTPGRARSFGPPSAERDAFGEA